MRHIGLFINIGIWVHLYPLFIIIRAYNGKKKHGKSITGNQRLPQNVLQIMLF